MSDFTSFRSVIALWPSKEDCAADTGATLPQVRKWWTRNRIPSDWWHSVLSTDRARSAGLSAEDLARLAAREPLEPAEVRA